VPKEGSHDGGYKWVSHKVGPPMGSPIGSYIRGLLKGGASSGVNLRWFPQGWAPKLGPSRAVPQGGSAKVGPLQGSTKGGSSRVVTQGRFTKRATNEVPKGWSTMVASQVESERGGPPRVSRIVGTKNGPQGVSP
jgi:hypothetical protein